MFDTIMLPESGACLAFDFGETRIGVAQGDCALGIATPLATISGSNNDEKFAQIARLIQEWQPQYLIVGLPTYLDGSEHDLSRLARKFGHRLNGRFGLPIFFTDERLSSVLAQEMLKQARVSSRKQKAVLDQVAAQAILQSFFEGSVMDFFNRNQVSGSHKPSIE
ncbi:MAG: Holliday junction resolvase RuvX [Alysiella sp.]|uniref:Holliday junction resolvase RuvX n=1 Tax=Alysiella sp. TaxID=1872483 RepID=UPI0026DB0C57|nr:Holliday junction resolvase RuvX [Alysiella sp.]MDO4433312.1 Holliday junction resolvase RuvX [Alysiella sp.]